MSKTPNHSLHIAREIGRATVVAIVLTTALTAITPAPAQAQGVVERMTKMARGFASATTEAAMASAVSTDLENRGLPTVTVGTLSVGVSKVDVRDEVGIRVHVFYFNSGEQPVSVPRPTDETFALVDAKGRRLLFLSMRVKSAAKDGTQLTVPALERATVTLLFSLPATDVADAILKVGADGVIRGIPLRTAPDPAAAVKDTVRPPKDTTTPPKPPSPSR